VPPFQKTSGALNLYRWRLRLTKMKIIPTPGPLINPHRPATKKSTKKSTPAWASWLIWPTPRNGIIACKGLCPFAVEKEYLKEYLFSF
jgi:hypothetical protein